MLPSFVAFPNSRGKFCSQKAFTLAEVLITLGIIGVVAAMTMPSLISNYQKMVLKTQFKKTYSLLSNAFKKAEADLDYAPECFYWSVSKYGPGYYSCVSRDDEGNCTKYETSDGGPLPADLNGLFSQCAQYREAILKNLKVIKTCNGNAYPDCIPEYEGNDTLKKAADDSLSDYDIGVATSGYGGYRKNNILTRNYVIVLADGQILISFNDTFNPSIFAVDINGKKGPNKWGHDLFGFRTYGSYGSSPLLTGDSAMPVDKNGISSPNMILNMNK